jgi:hypothetical protein
MTARKTALSSDTMPNNPMKLLYWRFGEIYCLRHQGKRISKEIITSSLFS